MSIRFVAIWAPNYALRVVVMVMMVVVCIGACSLNYSFSLLLGLTVVVVVIVTLCVRCSRHIIVLGLQWLVLVMITSLGFALLR